MSRFTYVILAAAIAALAMAPAGAQRAGQAQTLLEAAKQKESLQGDLAGAIKLYQAIVDQFSRTDRAAAAQALVAMAECYRKLEDAKARGTYERVVREFGEQKSAVALARARLAETGARAANADMANVRKWTGPKVDTSGMVSPDGRYVSFVDQETGDLALHDLTTGADRRLTNKGTWAQSSDYAEASAISRDGTQIAYSWYVSEKERYELRVMRLDAPGTATAKTVFDSSDAPWLAPYDWSADGTSVVVFLARSDRTGQIAMIHARDGSLRVLKQGSGPNRMFVSPDGSLIAYDSPVGGTLSQRDVFVVSTDGRVISSIVHPAYDMVVGWSPDGRSLLFARDRAGSYGLWALPFAKGSPQGKPLFITDLGSQFRDSLGLTRSGTLLYGLQVEAQGLHIASMDFETGKVLAPPDQVVDAYSEQNIFPDWSPDGKYLVYATRPRSGNEPEFLSILTIDTGEIAPIRSQLHQSGRPRWTRDGTLIVQGVDADRRRGIFRIDPRTGATSALVMEDLERGTSPAQASLSPDGRLLFYRMGTASDTSIVERDLGTGTERVLLRRPSLYALSLSPDGQELAFIEPQSSTLNILEVQSGQVRELFRAIEPMSLINFADWTPDSTRVVFGQSRETQHSAWVIPRTGGRLVKLELPTNTLAGNRSPRFHPDGRRVAYLSGEGKFEVWTLENFLPTAATIRK